MGEEVHCNSNNSNTNDQIAENEGFIYSPKYNRFFKDMVTKSRYIESLHREEHDLRTGEKIAQDSGVFYDDKNKMFFDSEEEKCAYNQSLQLNKSKTITCSDIVEADMARKIPQSKIESIKGFFKRVIDKIRGLGEK